MLNCKYWRQYLGPVVTIAGAIIIGVFIIWHPPVDYLISAWIIYSILSVSQFFSLAALGIGFSLVSSRLALFGGVFFLIGFLIGLINYDKVWMWFSNSPNASQHFYLTLPISSFFTGLLLVMPDRLRKWLVLIVALIVGAMLSITVKLTDPTLHDPFIPKLGFIIGIWVVLSVMLSVRSFYRPWFNIPIRILGSWLLASSFLYGGTALAVRYGVIIPKSTPIEAPKIEPSLDEDILIPDFTGEESSVILDNKRIKV